MKRVFTFLLAVIMLLAAIPLGSIQAQAAIIDSGDWGQDDDNVKWAMDSNGTLTISGKGKMLDCYVISTDTIHGTDWFRAWDRHMQDITSVVIKEGITYIGDESFSGAANLRSVTIADSVETIGMRAFSNCDSLTKITFGKGLKKTNIEVFSYCDGLTEFKFPNQTIEYGNGLFLGCSNLKSVTTSNKVTKIPDSTFKKCTKLETVNLSSSITNIHSEAFALCTNLKSITIPEGVNKIHSHAFADCINLESISLPNSLTAMGNDVFGYCPSLKTVTIPANVTNMAHTFEDAYGLESVEFLGNPPSCGGNLFGNITITAYYPGNNKAWTEDVLQDYGGNVTWIPVFRMDAPTVSVTNVSSSGKIKLSWNAVEGATEYKVYRATSKTGTYKRLTTVTGTSLTNTSAKVGTKYYYYVVAVNADGVASEKSNIVTRTCDLPRPVVKISVVSSTGKLKLRWDAIDGAAKYEVYRSTDGGKTYSLLKTVTGTSLTNTSITAGNKYYYKVKAIHSNSNANSAYSSARYGTCDLARPTAQVSLNSEGKPVVSWGEVAGAEKYIMYIYDADGNQLSSHSTTNLQLTHVGADKGETYSYRVMAVHSNTSANSAKSNTVSITAN